MDVRRPVGALDLPVVVSTQRSTPGFDPSTPCYAPGGY